MSSDDHQVQRVRLPEGGERFVLHRKLGASRHFGWFAVVLALIACCLCIAWIGDAFFEEQKLIQSEAVLGGLGALLFLLAATMVAAAGLAVVCEKTRTIIDVKNGSLSVCDVFFFCRVFKRRIALSEIQELKLIASQNDPDLATEMSTGYLGSQLNATRSDGGYVCIATAYPKDLLIGLANALSEAAGASIHFTYSDRRKKIDSPPELGVQVAGDGVSEFLLARNDRNEPVPQPDSRLQVIHSPETCQIKVPAPTWLSRLPFVAGGLLLTGLAMGGLGLTWMNSGADTEWSGVLFLGTILVAMLLWGLALLAIGLVFMSRRYELEVSKSKLSVLRRDLLSKRRFDWSPQDLQSVSLRDSGLSVNSQSKLQLWIRGSTRTLGLMTGFDRADLSLVATILRERTELARLEQA